MQHSPNEIKEKLLKALDKDNNVVDMSTVMEVITILEKIQITKEALEKTRLGKYINELRKKTANENLARRAKKLVRSWRKLILPSNESLAAVNGERTVQSSGVGVAHPDPGLFLQTNKPMSPALSNHHQHHHHRLHKNHSNSPLRVVGSPIDSFCSSTSTSPALLGYQGSRPGTPSSTCPAKTNVTSMRVTSPERDHFLSSAANHPSSVRQLSPSSSTTTTATALTTTTTDNKIHFHKDSFHNFRRHQALSPDGQNNFHKPAKHKSKIIVSPAISSSSSLTPTTTTTTTAATNSNSNDKVIRSSHSLNVDQVAKTNAANKRLRKDEEDDGIFHKKLCTDTNNFHKNKSANIMLKNSNAFSQSQGPMLNGLDHGDSNDSVRFIQEDEQVNETTTKVPGEPPPPITTNLTTNTATTTPTISMIRKGVEKRIVSKNEVSGDSLKEKLANHTRTQKVKTTAQLIEELRARNTSAHPLNVSSFLPSCPPDTTNKAASSSRASPMLNSSYARRLPNNVLGNNADHDITKTKTEMMEKFLLSSVGSGDGYNAVDHSYRHQRKKDNLFGNKMTADESPPPSATSMVHENESGLDEVKAGTSFESTNGPDPVDIILASLPPINPEEIDWGDDDVEVDCCEPKSEPLPPVAVTDDDDNVLLDKLLSEPCEGLNGNYDHQQEFREWREALSRRSYNNDLLHILPYVNID